MQTGNDVFSDNFLKVIISRRLPSHITGKKKIKNIVIGPKSTLCARVLTLGIAATRYHFLVFNFTADTYNILFIIVPVKSCGPDNTSGTTKAIKGRASSGFNSWVLASVAAFVYMVLV